MNPITQWNPWPHRLAMTLVCATFPLIWVGGLVTTYDAGMAVPDWPSTYGYNLFAYPWYTWITGPWDLFIEHGHRLFGALVGMIAISAVAVTWRCESRFWVKLVAAGALGLVVLQGCIGGLRVLLDNRQVAQIHGIVGPLFFTYAVLFSCVTSQWWWETDRRPSISSSVGSAAWFVVGLTAIQLLFGSQLRHVTGLSSRDLFALSVWMHIAVGMCLLAVIPLLFVAVLRLGVSAALLRPPAVVLVICIVLQVALGVTTWLTKYGLPGYFQSLVPNWTYTVQAEGMLGSMLATAHVANGALLLATSTWMAIRATRCGERSAKIVSEVQGSISARAAG